MKSSTEENQGGEKKNTTISKQLLLEEKDLQALMFMQCA